MIRSSLHSGKTAGDLAKERNKLEVSRRIDQVPPAKKLDGRVKTSSNQSKNKTDNKKCLKIEKPNMHFLWFLVVVQSHWKILRVI